MSTGEVTIRIVSAAVTRAARAAAPAGANVTPTSFTLTARFDARGGYELVVTNPSGAISNVALVTVRCTVGDLPTAATGEYSPRARLSRPRRQTWSFCRSAAGHDRVRRIDEAADPRAGRGAGAGLVTSG